MDATPVNIERGIIQAVVLTCADRIVKFVKVFLAA